MTTENSTEFISRNLAASYVLGALIAGTIIGYALASRPIGPRETPIEVAGNGIHVCSPFTPLGGSGTAYTGSVNNNTEAYISQGFGSSKTPVNLNKRSWTTLQVWPSNVDLPISLTVTQSSASQDLPVTITFDPNLRMTQAYPGALSTNCAPGGKCPAVDHFSFKDSSGPIVDVPCPGGKCVLYLGSLKNAAADFECWNH